MPGFNDWEVSQPINVSHEFFLFIIFQKEKEKKYAKVFNAFWSECPMISCFSGDIYKDMAKSLKKMYILLRKSLRQLDSEHKNRPSYRPIFQ